MMKKFWVLLIFISQLSFAQWVNNPAENTVINASFGSHYMAKISVNPDGTYFISWWGGSGNINMNLELFSHDGISLWNNPVLVSDHPQNSWVDDYNLVSDLEGNAIIVFSDIRNGGQKHTVAYKIDSNGEQVWGDDGIYLGVSGSNEYNPTAVVNTENDIFVLFSTNYENGDANKIYVHKIETDGNLPWGSNGKSFSGLSSSWALPFPMANNDAGFSFGFYKETGTFPALVRKIYMIRCDADGNQLWDSEASVTNAGGISAWDEINLKADGQGGAYFVWKDDRYMDNVAETYAQYVNPEGVAQWQENGVQVSDEAGYFQFYGHAAGVNNAGEFVLLWNKVNSNQNMAALMYQRISLGGELLETSYGKTIIPLTDKMLNGLHAEQMGDTTFFLYRYYLPNSTFYTSFNIIALDANGENVWDEVSQLSNSEIERNHANMCGFYQNQAVVVWTDQYSSGSRTMGQNIFTDGALGSSPVAIRNEEAQDINSCFVSFLANDKMLYLKDLQKDDMVILYNLQAQEVFRHPAKDKLKIDLQNHGVYIGRIIRKGEQIDSFKILY